MRAMQRSTDRFLTTHTGSLPRPDDLVRMMYAKEEGVPVEREALAARIRSAVADVVRKQAEAGVDLVNDGEMSKPSYATYIKDRLNGFGGTGNTFVYQDLADFPVLEKRVFGDPGRSRRKTPACNAPISVRDAQAAQDDVDNLEDHERHHQTVDPGDRDRHDLAHDHAAARGRARARGGRPGRIEDLRGRVQAR